MSTQNLLNERDYLINNDQSDEKKHVLEIEDTQYDQIGGFGKYQALHFGSILSGMLSGAFILYSIFFFVQDPQYICQFEG